MNHDYPKLKQICVRLCMPGGTADMQQVMNDVMEYAEAIFDMEEYDALEHYSSKLEAENNRLIEIMGSDVYLSKGFGDK